MLRGGEGRTRLTVMVYFGSYASVGNKKGSAKLPDRLYKYRDLTIRTLTMLVNDCLYFARPSEFNDPLDSRPSLESDLEEDELKRVARILIEQRSRLEIRKALSSAKVKGPKATNFVERRSREEAVRLIRHIEYNATNPDYDSETVLGSLLGGQIAQELQNRYEKGIVSLSEKDNCPLMWSHYGDEHRGVCVGYSVPDELIADVHKMEYGGSRLVLASDVAAMLNGDDGALRRVDQAVLSRKAASWSYEQEWRLTGPRGLQSSPLELEEIIFGIRCEPSSVYSVTKALEGRDRPVEFYELRDSWNTFDLRKHALDKDELFVHYPQRALSALEGFEDLSATTRE